MNVYDLPEDEREGLYTVRRLKGEYIAHPEIPPWYYDRRVGFLLYVLDDLGNEVLKSKTILTDEGTFILNPLLNLTPDHIVDSNNVIWERVNGLYCQSTKSLWVELHSL